MRFCAKRSLVWRCRVATFIASLVATGALAEDLDLLQEANPEPVQNAEWAIEITEKGFDEETGDLSLEITNTHDYLAVTAFGVAMVYDRGDGGGSMQVQAMDLLLGDPLVPGAAREMTFGLGGPKHESASSRYQAVQVVLHFEILADATSRGNTVYIDEFFATRAHRVIETEAMLERLHAVRSNPRDEVLAEFWANETQRRQEAHQFLRSTERNRPRRDLDRHGAIQGLTNLSVQIKQRIDSGESVDEMLGTLDVILREYTLEPLSEGVRPQDLERARGEEGGAE